MDRVGRKNVHSNNCEHISGSEKISLSVDYRYCERWIRLLLEVDLLAACELAVSLHGIRASGPCECPSVLGEAWRNGL